jgi:hypothetical protein
MLLSLDTDCCVPEDKETLLVQQRQLINGRRDAQMFPNGTPELPLPLGLKRHTNFRGVFHYRPGKLTPASIDLLSLCGKENEILLLGKYNKADIERRLRNGERLSCVTEYTPSGVEVRCAAGTTSTVDEQLAYFEDTKEAGNTIITGPLPKRVDAHFKGGF